jgi:hypothetical protein
MKDWRHLGSAASLWAILAAVLSFSVNAQKPVSKVAHTAVDCGNIAAQVLRCSQLGFIYKVPFGWVDRTRDMQASSEAATAPNTGEQESGHSSARLSGARTLLAIFQRPPGAPSQTINSAVIITAEPAADYPKVKTAADYFGPLAEIAEQHGLKVDGDPYSFVAGAKQLVRGDFTAGSDKTPIHQTSLVTIEKGYILSFTFVSSSEDEIDNLISALSFGARLPAASSHGR